jgi:hypothetical protein
MQKNDCADQTSTSTGGCTKKGYQRLQVEAYGALLDRPLTTTYRYKYRYCTGEKGKGDKKESGIYMRLGPTRVDHEKNLGFETIICWLKHKPLLPELTQQLH